MTQELREEARRREEERAHLARRREQLGRDVKELAGTAEGRRMFRWFIDQGNIFAEDYQSGPAGAYKAGLRAQALRLWRLLRDHLTDAEFIAVAIEDETDPAWDERDSRV